MKNSLWVRVLCWILAILMLGGASTYLIYAIFGMM